MKKNPPSPSRRPVNRSKHRAESGRLNLGSRRQFKPQLGPWLLGPLALLALLVLSYSLLAADASAFWRYMAAALAAGLLGLPLACRLLPRHPECLFLLGLPLGLCLWSWTQWTLSYLHLLPFRFGTQLLLFVLLLAASLAFPRLRRSCRLTLKSPRFWRSLPWQLLLFLLPALAMAFVRGLIPAAHGLEKFMDYGFMQSLMRSDFLPAADPWLAGSPINYYYYGQYLYTFLAKIAACPVSLAYNLGFAGTFAFLFSLSATWGYLLLRFFQGRRRSFLPYVAGALSALGCCFAGNAHDFFIGPRAPGRWILERLQTRAGQFGELLAYSFSESTRYIGYNPPTDDKTIHEFPYYSFLVGDLHAHLCNTLVVLFLLLLFLIAFRQAELIRFARSLRSDFRTLGPGRLRSGGGQALQLLKLSFTRPLLPLISLGLALCVMGNYWDFVIYWGASALFLLFLLRWGLGGSWQLSSLPLLFLQLCPLALVYLRLDQPGLLSLGLAASLLFSALCFSAWPRLFSALGLCLNILFFQAQLLSLPFQLQFQAMAKQLALVKSRTPIWQLAVLYGPQALFLLLAIAAVCLLALLHRRRTKLRQAAWKRYGLSARDLGLWKAQAEGSTEGQPRRQPDPAAKTQGDNPWARTLIPERYRRQHERQQRRQSRLVDTDRGPRLRPRQLGTGLFAPYLLLHLALICAGLILLPELVYVVDIYQGTFSRANTMFKFTYQACLLLGLCLPCLFVSALRACSESRQFRDEELRLEKEATGLAQGPLRDRTSGTSLLEQPGSPRAREACCRWQALQVRLSRNSRLRPLPVQVLLALVLGLLLLPQYCYPLFATREWLPPLSRANYRGLDATRWMLEPAPMLFGATGLKGDGSLKDDLAAIQWMNSNVQGQETLVEAAGKSYTEANRISAFTGLPTVLGWETHEWLWRSTNPKESAYVQVVAPLQEEIRRFYEAQDLQVARDFLQKHRVRYVYIGDIERQLYPQINEPLLRQLGQTIWEQGSALVIDLGQR